MKKLALTALLVAVAAPAVADEKVFNKCKARHSVIAAVGAEVVKGGKTGPNLGYQNGLSCRTSRLTLCSVMGNVYSLIFLQTPAGRRQDWSIGA